MRQGSLALTNHTCPHLDLTPSHARLRPLVGAAAGQEVEVSVRFTPHITGCISLFGVLDVAGAPTPCGFSMCSSTRDLDVRCVRAHQQAGRPSWWLGRSMRTWCLPPRHAAF